MKSTQNFDLKIQNYYAGTASANLFSLEGCIVQPDLS